MIRPDAVAHGQAGDATPTRSTMRRDFNTRGASIAYQAAIERLRLNFVPATVREDGPARRDHPYVGYLVARVYPARTNNAFGRCASFFVALSRTSPIPRPARLFAPCGVSALSDH